MNKIYLITAGSMAAIAVCPGHTDIDLKKLGFGPIEGIRIDWIGLARPETPAGTLVATDEGQVTGQEPRGWRIQ